MKNKWHSFYIALCDLITEKLCYAKRNQVGAVIVKGHNIVAYGYNGTPHGFPNVCEDVVVKKIDVVEVSILDTRNKPTNETGIAGVIKDSDLVTKPEVIHAEFNAIAKAARQGISTDGCILYCSVGPCIECAKLIIQSGIKHVIYKNDYRDMSGVNLLEKANVVVEKFSDLE